jgi:hypothetical protein
MQPEAAYRMRRIVTIAAATLAAATLLALAAGCSAARGAVDLDRFPNRRQREIALRYAADLRARSFQSVGARLRLGIDTALAWRQLDTLLASPTGDIFWTYPCAMFYFSSRDLLSEYWRRRFRQAWKRYTPYRGDTENHFLMYYASLLLFSQEWPGLDGSEWFNGKSSRENHDEAASYLDHWIDRTVREGMSEWDSPRYAYFYIGPLLTLSEYAADSTLGRRAGMMLEYLLADFATDYLAGSYCGAHSRDADGSVTDPRTAEVTSYGEFYFEETLEHPLPDLELAALCGFHAPPILAEIAHDRSVPFAETERKRSRAKIRFSTERYSAVEKYTWMTADYALGSIRPGLVQPIQQHTWDITFADARPDNTIFALHPDASARELGMFFPEEPELMESGVLQSKASYGSPDKWVGGSACEAIYQFRSTLFGFYDIPEGARYRHVDFFLPKSLDTLIRDGSGWIIARMGRAFAGIDLLKADSVAWIEEPRDWRLRIFDRRAAYVVECGSEQTIGFDAFLARLRATHPRRFDAAIDTLDYRSPFGPEIHIGPADSAGARSMVVDGFTAPDFTRLFDGPNITSDAGSGVVTLRADGRTRILDFVRNEIR